MAKYRFQFQTETGYVKGRAVGDISETGVMDNFTEFYAIKFTEQNNPIEYVNISSDSYISSESSYLVISSENGNNEEYEVICDVFEEIGHEIYLHSTAEVILGSFTNEVLKGYLFFNEGIESNETSEGFKWKIADFILLFGDKFSLTPNYKSSFFITKNPGNINLTGQTNPTNPSTFKMSQTFNFGYINPNDADEVFNSQGHENYEGGELNFYDSQGNLEASFALENAYFNLNQD